MSGRIPAAPMLTEWKGAFAAHPLTLTIERDDYAKISLRTVYPPALQKAVWEMRDHGWGIQPHDVYKEGCVLQDTLLLVRDAPTIQFCRDSLALPVQEKPSAYGARCRETTLGLTR